jgi:hypothetical protein
MTAPVDLTQTGYRTLLLGMKASKMYHYRIVATGPGGTCTGPDNMLMTGALANGLQKPTVTTNNAAALFGGFLITGQYTMNVGSTGQPAYILDADGDYVWWYAVTGSDATGVRMSYDGTHMWINGANVPSGTAHVHRVTMDGMMDEDLSAQFTGHPTRPSRSTPTGPTAATTSRSARPAARSRPSSTPAPRTAAPALVT